MAIQEGVIGAEILYQVKNPDGTPLPINSATQIKYNIKKPDGTEVQVTPVFHTTGDDGVLSYVTTEATELTPHGWYYVQPEFNLGLFSGRITADRFFVYRNI